MQVAVEISMYPFRPDYEPSILDFIRRLKQQAGVRVEVNDMSTQVFGTFESVMPMVTSAIKAAFTEEQTTVMVMKVLHISKKD